MLTLAGIFVFQASLFNSPLVDELMPAIRWGFDGPSGTDPKTGGAGVTSYRRYRLHPRSSDGHDQRLPPSALPVFPRSIGYFKNTRRVRLSPAVDRVALQRL